MCDQNKINKHIYHPLYVLTKGNQSKNKQVLLESIHKLKAVRDMKRSLKDQVEARNGRAGTRIERKSNREEKKIIKR